MIDFDEVAKIIDSYPAEFDFMGSMHPDRVREAETKLGVLFPKSYRQFLERYGCGCFGREIYGVTASNTGVPSAVWYTLKIRQEGFIPDWMVIICAEDEFVFCLDTSTISEKGECKVVSWILGLSLDAQPFQYTFDSFADFLHECVHEAVERRVQK